MKNINETTLTLEDHKKAFTETSFLLSILTGTMKELVGSGASTVATSAGKEIAKKMPIYIKNPSIEEVTATLQKRLAAGFDFSCEPVDDGLNLSFTKCAIRDVCENRGMEIGGELCSIFHYYLGGMFSQFSKKQTRPKILSSGCDRCETHLIIR